jgi:hypothetical protein
VKVFSIACNSASITSVVPKDGLAVLYSVEETERRWAGMKSVLFLVKKNPW